MIHTHTQTLFRLMPVNYGNMDEKESITLSEISKTERQILKSIAYTWNPKNKQKTVLNSWREAKWLSRVWLFATPWTLAYQVPSPMGFSRQECWSGLPFPSPGDLPNPGIEPGCPASQADTLTSEPPAKPERAKSKRKVVTRGQELGEIGKDK